MAPITGSIEISRPPQDVFDYLGDLSRHTEWQTGLRSVELVTDGPPRVGSRAKETRHVPGGNQTYEYEITQWDPPRACAFKVVTGPIRPEGTLRLTSLDNGTRTRVDFEMEVQGQGFGKVLVPLAARDARKHVPGDLQALKERLESPAASSAGG